MNTPSFTENNKCLVLLTTTQCWSHLYSLLFIGVYKMNCICCIQVGGKNKVHNTFLPLGGSRFQQSDIANPFWPQTNWLE